ncbi:MAG: aldo/keto reductase [Syntrophobacteraceae bacterium]|nr:aldo/keto reductase [Syntrophobacteraceae bacterium]
MHTADIDTRELGSSGRPVSLVGLGGEGILRTQGQEDGASQVIRRAVEQGITYFDCARAYAGSEGYYGKFWRHHPELRARVFQASKSAQRTRSGALSDLDVTLKTMGVDHLDLWQIHDVRDQDDLDRISGPGGALEAFVEARQTGKVGSIGVTGHHDPEILLRALRDWPVDSVMMPVNPVEAILGGFLTRTLPEARRKGLAVIAMKVLGAGRYLAPPEGATPRNLIRFALSQDVSVAIVGCSTPGHVDTLVESGRPFHPMGLEEQRELVARFEPVSRRMAFYRGVV